MYFIEVYPVNINKSVIIAHGGSKTYREDGAQWTHNAAHSSLIVHVSGRYVMDGRLCSNYLHT